MKVLHISSEKSWRGGEQQIAYLIQESAKANVECEVVCRTGSSFHSFCKREDIANTGKSFSGFGILRTAIFIKKYARQNGFDIIHVHSAKSHLVTYISLLLGLKVPVILSRRVDFEPSNSWLTRHRYNYSGIRKIVCVSDAIQAIMRKYLSQEKDRCITVHSGIDVSKFRNGSSSLYQLYNINTSKQLVGNTSALADHKDYFTFIDTAEIILKQNNRCHFIIFGEGPLENEIKEYVKIKNLISHVTFTGFVNNIPELLPSLNVFLMTSKTEGLGTSILDAFAAKVPVVATHVGGIPEIVLNNYTGLTYEAMDSEGLAKGVLRILDDNILTKKLTTNAYNLLINDFTKEKMAQNTIEVYNDILKLQPTSVAKQKAP